MEAVRELLRVTRPDGRLVITLPFGLVDGKILDGSARGYTRESIRRFEEVATLDSCEYYEYQHANYQRHFDEYDGQNPLTLTEHLRLSVRHRLGLKTGDSSSVLQQKAVDKLPDRPGRVTCRHA